MINDMLYTIKSVMLGHAVADALGVPVEFHSREELDRDPVTDMRGYGTYPYPAGSWSDDTSMSLCELDVLAGGAFDKDKIMQNFCRWLYNGEFTPEGKCFDVGGTCKRAISSYFKGQPADKCGEMHEYSCGNGSLMRMLPFILFYECCDHGQDRPEFIGDASSLTHAHGRAVVGCGIYFYVVAHLLYDANIGSIEIALRRARSAYCDNPELEHYKRIFDKDFKNLQREEVKSSGYVVDTLEAALWCLLTTENYKDCVLKAVNLGDDTDTVAAVAGGMAGALYGMDSIPKEWLGTLKCRDYIEDMCERVASNWKVVREKRKM